MTSRPEEEPEPAFEHADIDPHELAGFAESLVAHEWRDDAFELDGVGVQAVLGLWFAMLGAYEPPAGEKTGQELEELSDMLAWTNGARRSLRVAWGEPMVVHPRVTGDDAVPEGVIDVLLLRLGVDSAEVWDRGERFVAILTGWRGEPEESPLVQVLLVLPREVAMGGLTTLNPGEITEQELLMHGEALGELHRRAAILSTLFDQGEARLRTAPVLATRCNLKSTSGETTVWVFADDGRALLLIRHPEVVLDDGTDDGELAASARVLSDVPSDLRACAAAPGERPDGSVAEHALEFGIVAGTAVPRITGAFWFDGQTWRAPRQLLEIAVRDGLGFDDLGFRSTVRRPYRLGGTFDAADVSPDGDSEEEISARVRVERLFAECPYQPGPRPTGERRLGYVVPRGGTRGGIVDDIERVCGDWWERDGTGGAWNGSAFRIGGRTLDPDDDGRTLTGILGEAEPWYLDEFADWNDGLFAVMSERWGDPFQMTVRDRFGAVRRTPTTRVMRAAGFDDAPGWWVDGHAVLLLAGAASERSIGVPSVMLLIARADAVLDPMGGTTTWQLRSRARVLGALGGRPNETIPWDGPPLAASGDVPDATRGGIRTDAATWAWFFTHDGRGLLLSCTSAYVPEPTAEGTFARLAEMFEGVPDDLLSLVLDRDAGGLYETAQRPDSGNAAEREGGALAAAQSVPVVTGVQWSDDTDWRTSDGLLRRARDIVTGTDPNGNPLGWIRSVDTGLRALSAALCAGEDFDADVFTDERYTDLVFGGAVDPDDVDAAMSAVLPALEASRTGTLNDVLDVVAYGPGHRFLLDAALSNPDPHSRREIALWLLEEGADPATQLSFLTPVNVLIDNPTLCARDAPVLRQLVLSGAAIASTSFGATSGGHALVQLCDRDLDESEIAPLYRAILDPVEEGTGDPKDTAQDTEPCVMPLGLGAPALRDGRSVVAYVRAGAFPHSRSRAGLLRALSARPATAEDHITSPM